MKLIPANKWIQLNFSPQKENTGLLTDPSLVTNFQSFQDLFTIKSSSTKYKTKAARLRFFNDLSNKLKDLHVDKKTLEVIRSFLGKQRDAKMTKNVQVIYVEGEHQVLLPQISHSSTLVTSLRPVLDVLKDDDLANPLHTFDVTSDTVNRDSVDSNILQKAFDLAMQTVVNLNIGSLLIIKINTLSCACLKIWTQDSSLCFSTIQNYVIQPGQLLTLPIEAVTDYPSTPTDVVYYLHGYLPVYFNFSILYNLKFHFIRIINV